MLLLLLLGTCFGVGFSYYETKEYGDTHRMKLHRKAESLEFSPNYNTDKTVLWKRDDPSAREDSRRRVVGSYLVIYNLTQEDSGQYKMRDKNQILLSINKIEVKERERSYERRPHESLTITSDLNPDSCNIYFVPESDYEQREVGIVRRGRLQEDSYQFYCQGFELLKPCGILNLDLEMSCAGRYEVRDSNDNKALVALLEMESPLFDLSNIGIGIGVFCAVLSCCVYVRRCCCGKSSSKKNGSETPDDEPAVHYHEPVGTRTEQPGPAAGRHYPTQPSTTQIGPLIHSPPRMPPAYSEISAPAEMEDAPTVPVLSDPDPEPRFELKGMTFPSAPPLSSHSTYNDVYTSNKLNFL